MKHCILAKFTPEAKAQRAALLPRIREIFSAAADIPGVHGAEVIPKFLCCSPRWPIPFFTARGSSISSVLLWTKALKNYSIFGRPLWIMYCF